MLLIERIFAQLTIWLCDLTDLTQTDIDDYKQRELRRAEGSSGRSHGSWGTRSAQIVVRFRN